MRVARSGHLFPLLIVAALIPFLVVATAAAPVDRPPSRPASAAAASGEVTGFTLTVQQYATQVDVCDGQIATPKAVVAVQVDASASLVWPGVKVEVYGPPSPRSPEGTRLWYWAQTDTWVTAPHDRVGAGQQILPATMKGRWRFEASSLDGLWSAECSVERL